MRKKNNDTLEIIIFIFIFGLVSFGLIHAGFYLCNKYSPHAKYLLSDEYIDTKYSAEHGGGKVDNDPWDDFFYYHIDTEGEILERYRIKYRCFYSIDVKGEINEYEISFNKFNWYHEGDNIKMHLIQKISKLDGDEITHEYSVCIQ